MSPKEGQTLSDAGPTSEDLMMNRCWWAEKSSRPIQSATDEGVSTTKKHTHTQRLCNKMLPQALSQKSSRYSREDPHRIKLSASLPRRLAAKAGATRGKTRKGSPPWEISLFTKIEELKTLYDRPGRGTVRHRCRCTKRFKNNKKKQTRCREMNNNNKINMKTQQSC